jgi:hypothetical protein
MRIVLILAVGLLCGCASDYAKFYRSDVNASPSFVAKYREAPAPKVPALDHAGGEPGDILAAYGRHGYALIVSTPIVT